MAINKYEPHPFLRFPVGHFCDPKYDNGTCWYVVSHRYCGLPPEDGTHKGGTSTISEKDRVQIRQILLTHYEGTELSKALDHFVSAVRQEARAAAFRDAIEIVDGLVCDPRYDGNWRNGYGQAQNDIQDALEAAANSVKDSEGEGAEDDGC